MYVDNRVMRNCQDCFKNNVVASGEFAKKVMSPLKMLGPLSQSQAHVLSLCMSAQEWD